MSSISTNTRQPTRHRFNCPWRAIEPWLDLTFPLATALLLANHARAANAILFLWLCSRLTLFSSHRHPQNWILAGLALVNCGTIVLDQGSKPSDPSDLLVIGLAFAAGLQRCQHQWKNSTAAISLCLIPIAIAALHNGTDALLHFPGVNVNRMSFLLGLVAIASYATCQWSPSFKRRLTWGALATLSIPLALATGSRAAVVAPAITLATTTLICFYQRQKTRTIKLRSTNTKAAIMLAAILTTTAFTVYTWYSNPKESTENRVNDIKRFETAACWFKAPFKYDKQFSGLGFNEKVRKRCDGDDLPFMRESDHQKGLPHAHNVASQLMGETGIPGLAALIGTATWATATVWKHLAKLKTCNQKAIYLTLPIFLYLTITSLTTSFYIYLLLNQILIGYLLGSLTMRIVDQTKPSQRNGC